MRIGAGWISQTQDGKTYMSCKISVPFLGELSFALFKNERKEKDNQPDYEIVWNESKKKSRTAESPIDDGYSDNVPF